MVHQRWTERPEGAQDTFASLYGPVVTDGDDSNRVTVRRGRQHGIGRQCVGFRLGKVAVEGEDLSRLLERVDHHARQHRANPMELILKRGDDAKVSTPAPDTPEEVGILSDAGCDELTSSR